VDLFLAVDLAALLVLFFFSGAFSATETALLSMGRARLANAIEQGGKRGQALEAWRKDPNRLLTTILILNNAVNISATTMAAFLAFHLSEILHWNRAQMGALVAALVTLLIIVFGEVSPKLLAIRRAVPIALLVIRPLVFFEWLLRPLAKLVVWLANRFLRIFGQEPGAYVPLITEEEITTLIKMGADAGVFEDAEHKMLHKVIGLGDKQVREVMVPRIEVEGIDADAPMERIIDQIIQAGYSRMPVYRENLDNISGVIYTKDIIAILQNRELIVLQDILRQPYFVPEMKRVDDLLREFQKGKIHMAIVVDEYGGTAGLVTLEDLIEEIVGEIQDEYDVEEMNIEKIEDSVWVVSGQTDLEEINNVLGANLPNFKDINTIGGMLSEQLGRLPHKGEILIYQNLQFTVLAASRRKVDKIQIRRLPDAAQER